MIWIFDLDNTLFDASRHVFPWMKKAMETYLQSRLGLSLPEAQMLRRRYRRQYGSTMAGLLRQHAIDPNDFIDSIHPVSELPRLVPTNPYLKAVLTGLPGKKFVYTNAARFYTEEVLRLLGVGHCFEGIFTIEDANFAPKPDRGAFKKMLKTFGLNHQTSVFIEDQARNLETAKSLGLGTILVHHAPKRYPFVDMRIYTLKALPKLQQTISFH